MGIKVLVLDSSHPADRKTCSKIEKKDNNIDVFPVHQENIVGIEENSPVSTVKQVKNESFFQKHKGKILVAGSLLGIAGLTAGIKALLAAGSGPIAFSGILGTLIFGGAGLVMMLDKLMKHNDEKLTKKTLGDLQNEKSKQPQTAELDKTLLRVGKNHSVKEFVAFNTNQNVFAQEVHVPMAVTMNRLLEKYSTKDNPEISEQEQVLLAEDLKKFFEDFKAKISNDNNFLNPYRYGQPSLVSAMKKFKEKESVITDLIKHVTSDESASGKNIDKNELLDLREKVFLILNHA